MKTVAVHSGAFHADDVFAVAILRLIHPKIKAIRTRDEKKLAKADMRIDVGGRYNPKTNDFDHHQASFNKKRKNDMPYAASGLIWEQFGNKLVRDKEAFDYIDETLIQFVDALDVGLDTYEIKTIAPYTIRQVLFSFYPNWDEKTQNMDRGFDKAVEFTLDLLKRQIKRANSLSKANKVIRGLISKSNKEYIILDHFIPWLDIAVKESNIKFVICKKEDSTWSAKAVPKVLNTFDYKVLFPKEWAGIRDQALIKKTGVKEAIFCHKKRFVVIAKSKEGAIKLVEKALAQ